MKISNKSIWLIGCFYFVISCQKPTNNSTTATSQATQKFEFKIISAPHKTFGYDISVDGKPFIHQDNIPATGGIEGFKTEEKAKKAAQLVIEKMKTDNQLPSVTVNELAQIGAL
jgi:Domain of unknown function (DUF4907)